jgi:hypothetical protein
MSMPEGAVLRGLDAVAEALRSEDMPIDKQGLAYAVGDAEIEDGRGGWLPVRVALDRVSAERFETADAAVDALRAAAREGAGGGA